MLQADFCVIIAVRDGQAEPLRATIAGYCDIARPGHALRDRADIDFARIPKLHNIRAAILDDPSLGDRVVHKVAWPDERIYLAILGCCDGTADALLAALVRESPGWLAALLGHCEGFEPGIDLLAYLRDHRVGSAASYVNGPGRTVVEVHENQALAAVLRTERACLPPGDVQTRATALRLAVAAHRPALTPPAAEPLAARLRSLLNLLSVPAAVLLFLVLLPLLWWLLLPALVAGLVYLRHLEKTDPVYVVPPDPADIARRSSFEDHDTTNPFTAIGSVKPGWFRHMLVLVVLYVIDWGARHLFRANRLGRVGTIHFARWVLIDHGRRVIFTSEYDGSAEAYMDDFINKVGFGLNASFTHGIGYPQTRWMILDGASDEQRFKYFMRHHQIITQSWWRAYPGLTTFDLARHQRLRHGYETVMNDVDTARWLTECAL